MNRFELLYIIYFKIINFHSFMHIRPLTVSLKFRYLAATRYIYRNTRNMKITMFKGYPLFLIFYDILSDFYIKYC